MASAEPFRKRLERRIERAVELLRESRFSIGIDTIDVTAITDRYERSITKYVNDLVKGPFRKAVIERPRLVERWHLHDYITALKDDTDVFLLSRLATAEYAAGLAPGEPYWPANVAPTDLAAALERAGGKDAAPLTEALRKGWFFPKGPDRRLGALPEAHTEIEEDGGKRVSPELGRAMARWPIRLSALIVSIEKEVHEDRQKPLIAIGATKQARAALQMFNTNGPWVTDSTAPDLLKPVFKEGRIELVWNGTPRPYQLALPLDSSRFELEILRSILRELQEGGLRDWLVLHRMAAEHGRKGSFVWSWKEHRDRTTYERRVRNKSSSDRELYEEVVRRLWRFKSAEIREVEERGSVRKWRRIGPFGLIDIPGAIDVDKSLELAVIELNPALYDGARKDSRRPNFALLSNEALHLDGKTLRLGAELSLAMRYQRDNGGSVVRTSRVLWQQCDIRDGKPNRSDWPRADIALARALDRLVEAEVIGSWEREAGEPSGDRRYEIQPTAAWRDQVLHEVPPSLPPARNELPKSGAELRQWRERRGLTQAAAAAALSVSDNTLQRAEAAPEKPLGRALSKALVAYRPTPKGW